MLFTLVNLSTHRFVWDPSSCGIFQNLFSLTEWPDVSAWHWQGILFYRQEKFCGKGDWLPLPWQLILDFWVALINIYNHLTAENMGALLLLYCFTLANEAVYLVTVFVSFLFVRQFVNIGIIFMTQEINCWIIDLIIFIYYVILIFLACCFLLFHYNH